MTQITAILPAYNEEVSIGSIVLGAKRHVDNVIVIDDGSTDKTLILAELAGAEVIKHSSNQGKGAALKTGFKAAENADIIVTMDGDGQHNPEDIKKLVEPLIKGEADIVNGSRYLNGKNNDTPGYRRLGQTVLDKATNIRSGLNITDTQSGFRAFAHHTLPVFKFSKSGFGIESEMLMEAADSGLDIKEVEIKVRYDINSSTEGPFSHGFGVLFSILNEIELERPLIYFSLPGLIITIIGLIYALTFIKAYLTGASTSSAATILAILLTLFGGFILFTGIILDSISRMFNRLTDNYKNINNVESEKVIQNSSKKTEK